MHMKPGTAKNAAPLQTAFKFIESLESRRLLSGSGFFVDHAPSHAWKDYSVPAESVNFGHASPALLHSSHFDSADIGSQFGNLDRQPGKTEGSHSGGWDHSISRNHDIVVVNDNPRSDDKQTYPIDFPNFEKNPPAHPTIGEGFFGFDPGFGFPPGVHTITPPIGVPTPWEGGSSPITGSSSDWSKADNDDALVNSTPTQSAGNIHPGIEHPPANDPAAHLSNESFPDNFPFNVPHTGGQTFIPSLVKPATPSTAVPAIVRPNSASNVSTTTGTNGPAYTPATTLASPTPSETRIPEVAARGAKADAPVLPTSFARSLIVGSTQFTIAFVADSELMARAFAVFLPQSIEMAELAVNSEAAPVARAGAEAAVNVTAMAESLAAPQAIARTASAARAFFNIAPINATAMFSDALASFANDFASLPQASTPQQAGSRRAWAITAAVLTVDGMLLGRWYLSRRKASKAAALFRDGPAFA